MLFQVCATGAALCRLQQPSVVEVVADLGRQWVVRFSSGTEVDLPIQCSDLNPALAKLSQSSTPAKFSSRVEAFLMGRKATSGAVRPRLFSCEPQDKNLRFLRCCRAKAHCLWPPSKLSTADQLASRPFVGLELEAIPKCCMTHVSADSACGPIPPGQPRRHPGHPASHQRAQGP